MTMRIKIGNEGPYEAVVNVWEQTMRQAVHGGETVVERHELKPGEDVMVTIYSWRRGVTVMEMAAREDTAPSRRGEDTQAADCLPRHRT